MQMTAMPFVSYERTVFYRERAASMYSSFPYSSALALVEARLLLPALLPSVTPNPAQHPDVPW